MPETMPSLYFSPARQLLIEAEALCKEIYPGTFSFPRWRTDGSALWLESSSGSHLMMVDFVMGQVRVPQWKTERDGTCPFRQIPEHWLALHRGSLFMADGSAHDQEAFLYSNREVEKAKVLA